MMMFYSFLISTIPFLSSDSWCNEMQWQITGKSTLEISGTTSVNDFHCLSVNYKGEDIMNKSCWQSDNKSSLSGEISMKSVGFDCHNSM